MGNRFPGGDEDRRQLVQCKLMQHFKTLYPIVKYDPDMKPNPTRWLVDEFWQMGKINGMAGFEKSGKSRLMNWLLVGMSAGNVLGLAAEPKKILYLCGEETVSTVNDRIKESVRYWFYRSSSDAVRFQKATR